MTKKKPEHHDHFEPEIELLADNPELLLPPHQRSVSSAPPPLPSTYSSVRKSSPPAIRKKTTVPFSTLITPPPPRTFSEKEAASGIQHLQPTKPPPDLHHETLRQEALVFRHSQIVKDLANIYGIQYEHTENWIKIMTHSKLTEAATRIKYREESEKISNKNQLLELSWQYLRDHDLRNNRHKRSATTNPERFPKPNRTIAIPENLESDKKKK